MICTSVIEHYTFNLYVTHICTQLLDRERINVAV